MKSQALGKNISDVEIQNISHNGIWLYVYDKEYFLPFKEYPWFKNATIADICNVSFINGYRLEWPSLDIDLELEALEHPEKYPLIYS